jgi:Pentapeptide repeats (8 copies)
MTRQEILDAVKAGADLHGADLYGADLCGADLRGADLCGADLRGADLCGANLRGASLCGANLRGANLYATNLHGANLSGAVGYICMGWDKRDYHFRAIMHADGWRISAGCRWFTVDEAIAHWTARGNKDALARVAIVAAHVEE